MRFYRALAPFKVITFDLDDTLYDNRPTISAAENQFLSQLATLCENFQSADWYALKNTLAAKDPLLAEDVVAWREAALRTWLKNLGWQEAEIAAKTIELMAEFVHWRHKIDVPAESFRVLKQLSQRYDLSVITNGNVEAARLGFSHFAFSLRGGEHGRAKPHADLFKQTAARFGVRPEDILHVGDNLVTDVQGAILAGAQAAWINLSGQTLNGFPEARTLPTFEINNLTELLQL